MYFMNDFSDPNEDRNLMVDKISIDGVDYQSENMFSLGTWTPSNGCGGRE